MVAKKEWGYLEKHNILGVILLTKPNIFGLYLGIEVHQEYI